jgi:hypothetical protein
MKFTVKRSEWLRGEGHDTSRLRRAGDGKKCCWGFACEQMGISLSLSYEPPGISSILQQMPLDQRATSPLMEFCTVKLYSDFLCEKEWVYETYAVNDSEVISDACREQRLKELFAAEGHEIEFVD